MKKKGSWNLDRIVSYSIKGMLYSVIAAIIGFALGFLFELINSPGFLFGLFFIVSVIGYVAFFLSLFAFQVGMIISAWQKKEWVWFIFNLITWISAVIYYHVNYKVRKH